MTPMTLHMMHVCQVCERERQRDHDSNDPTHDACLPGAKSIRSYTMVSGWIRVESLWVT